MALQNLRSNTANKRPTASGMVDGQVAINTNATNPGLFFKDAGDGIRKVGPVFIGSSAPNSSPAAGGSSGHSIGEQWLDTSGSRYIVKTWDGTAWRDDDSNYLQLTGGALSGALTINNAANVAALDLKFDGDTDTGFYAPAANTLGFVTGGTERIRIDNSGRVGVKTTSMGSLYAGGDDLVIGDGGASNQGMTLYTGASDQGIIAFADGFTGAAQQYAGYLLYDHGTDSFRVATTGQERLRIDSLGNVAIGTTSIDRQFHVQGGGVSGTQVQIEGTVDSAGVKLVPASGNQYEIQANTSGSFFVYDRTNTTYRMLIDSSGKIGIGTTSPQAPFVISNSGAQGIEAGYSAGTSTNFIQAYNRSSSAFIQLDVIGNPLVFKTGSGATERLRIDSSGNLKQTIASGANNGFTVNNGTNDLFAFGTGGFAVNGGTATDGGIRAYNNLVFGSGSSSTERMRIDSAGNLGLGLTSLPATGFNKVLRVKPATGAAGIFVESFDSAHYLGLFGGTSASDSAAVLYPSAGSLRFGTTSGLGTPGWSEKLRIDSSGNLGIGDSSPANTLSVLGASTTGGSSTGNVAEFAGPSNTNGFQVFVNDTNNNSGIQTKNGDALIVNPHGGNVAIGATSADAKLHVAYSAGNPQIIIERTTSSTGKYGLHAFSNTFTIRDEAQSQERLRIDSSGNLGVGESSPDQRLHVKTSSDDVIKLESTSGGNGPNLTFAHTGASPADNDVTAKLTFVATNDASQETTFADIKVITTDVSDGSEDAAFAFSTRNNGTFAERVRIDSSGNVGIGTTSPVALLTVGSTSNSNTNATIASSTTGTGGLYFYDGANSGALIYDHTDNFLQFRVNGGEKARIDASSRLMVGTTTAGPTTADDLTLATSGNTGISIRSGTSSAGNIFFSDGTSGGDTTRGVIQYDHASNYMRLYTDNAERMRIDSSGNVGIGTTSPSGKLNIEGSDSQLLNLVQSSGDLAIRLNDAGVGSAYIKVRDNTGGSLSFDTGGSERMRINSSGRVGIGDSSPSHALVVKDAGATNTSNYLNVISGNAANAGIAFGDTDSDLVGGVLYNHTDNALRFFKSGFTEAARIDSSGRLLVGTSSSSTQGKVVIVGNSNSSTGEGELHLARGATPTSQQNLGNIHFGGVGLEKAAQIICKRDGGTWTSGSSHPSRLEFLTTANGASSPTERLRISNTGKVNTHSTAFGLEAGVTASAGTTTAIYTGAHSASVINGGVVSYRVWSNGNVQNTNNSYSQLSDVKLKENIVDANSQWDDLKAIQIRNWNFKAETGYETHTQIGVVAQEIETVSPGLVYDTPDRDDEGNDLGTVTKSVNYSVLYVKAIKALQEAMDRIETLETKVAALEAE